MKILEVEIDLIRNVYNFINFKIYEIVFNSRSRNRENIIILLPPEYKYFLEKFIRTELCFPNPINFNPIKIEIQGIEIKFISPTNDCYIFISDYTLYENYENSVYFKLELNKFV